MRMNNDFRIKGWAATLVLKQRPEGTRKWPIELKLEEGCLPLSLIVLLCTLCLDSLNLVHPRRPRGR